MTSLTPLRDATDIAAHGGKAIQLARLITAGLPIPEGFVIPRDLAPHQLALAADTLLAWATHARTPYELIVRSSAPVEDGPQASFAGLYASRFTVTEAPALLDAITQVRTSGARAAVRAYADAHRIQVPRRVAAIVQPAIRPYCAGVLIGQLRDDTWTTWQIEAVHGLADPLVSGHVSGELHHPGQPPTRAAQTDMVLPARPAELHLPPGEWITVDDHEGRAGRAKIRTSAGGLVTVLRPPAWTTRPILSPTDRDRLLELAAASAAVIGITNLDLEGTISPDGTLHLLQARPLTRTVPLRRSALQPGADARGWQGIPASPGCASGPSLNLATARGSAMGTVLICGNIGPDAAAVLLQRPAAIAATTGGPLSHAAIVARELGIPCVTALPKHLLTLPDGTPVAVDGIAGTVHIDTDTHQPEPDPQLAIDGAAVLTWPEPDPRRCDGRAATIIMLEPGTDPAAVIGEAVDSLGRWAFSSSATRHYPRCHPGTTNCPSPALDVSDGHMTQVRSPPGCWSSTRRRRSGSGPSPRPCRPASPDQAGRAMPTRGRSAISEGISHLLQVARPPLQDPLPRREQSSDPLAGLPAHIPELRRPQISKPLPPQPPHRIGQRLPIHRHHPPVRSGEHRDPLHVEDTVLATEHDLPGPDQLIDISAHAHPIPVQNRHDLLAAEQQIPHVQITMNTAERPQRRRHSRPQMRMRSQQLQTPLQQRPHPHVVRRRFGNTGDDLVDAADKFLHGRDLSNCHLQRIRDGRQPALARNIGKGLIDHAHQMTKTRDSRKRQIITCPMRAVDPRNQAVIAAPHIDHVLTAHRTNRRDHRNRPRRQPRNHSEHAASCLSGNVQNPPQDIPTRTSPDHPVTIHPAISQIPILRNTRQRKRHLQAWKISGQIRETNIVFTAHLQNVTATGLATLDLAHSATDLLTILGLQQRAEQL